MLWSKSVSILVASLGLWPTTNGAAIDDDWVVTFKDAVATFVVSLTEPEVKVTYVASEPDGNSKYYEQKVLLKDCLDYGTDGAVASAIVRIPDSAYDGGTGELTTWVDIDTNIIESSADFWIRTSPTQGKIEFCVEMILYNEQNLGMAVEYTKVKIDVDTSKEFQVTGVTYANEAKTTKDQAVRVDYPLTTYFCDDNNAADADPTLYPGDVLQVCVKSDASDAHVTDVRLVEFVNTDPEPDLSIVVIDGAGVATNGQTLKSCDAATGVCNIKSVTFSSLYQLDTNNDGVLEDVSADAGMKGIAVLNFGPPSRRLEGDAHSERHLASVTGFELDLGGNLEQFPTSSSNNDASSANGTTALGGAVGAGVGVAALVGAVAAMLVYRRAGQKIEVGRDVETTEPAEPQNGTGMI